MDDFVNYMGISSWRLFPPSYYYIYTPEEIEQMKEREIKKVKEIFDIWEREEEEERLGIKYPEQEEKTFLKCGLAVIKSVTFQGVMQKLRKWAVGFIRDTKVRIKEYIKLQKRLFDRCG